MAEKNKKHPGGRPPILKDVKTAEKLIDEYFEKCKPEYIKDDEGNIRTDRYGAPVMIQKEKPTITGLALALGFISRQSIYDYQKNKEYSYIITRAILKVENSYEQKLYDKNNNAQFALQNMGWNNKHQLEHSGSLGVTIVDDIK